MLTHSRCEKHAIISRNEQQNMTIIGIKLKEVLFPQKQEKIVKVSDGGTPSDGGTITLPSYGSSLHP